MRTRIIAFVFLMAALALPLFLYWYFMVREESTLAFIPSDSNASYTVKLKWTLNYSLLPLADKFLEFKKECRGECTLWPLPPVDYEVSITSTGNMSVVQTRTVVWGSHESISFEILPDIMTQALGEQVNPLSLNLPAGYMSLSDTWEWNLLVLQKDAEGSSLGFWNGSTYRRIRQIWDDIANIALDRSGEYILLEWPNTLLTVSRDFSHEIEIPDRFWIPLIVSRYGNAWKILTQSGVYEKNGNDWEENLRFTDYIDLTPYHRIWYIAPTDNARLSLGNHPLGQWVFVSLDRRTAKSYVIQKGVDILGFYYAGEKPAYVETDGKKYLLQLSPQE